MNISKQQAEQISSEIDSAIAAILEKHGLQRGKRSIQYGDLFTYKVEASALIQGENGVNLGSKEAQAWIVNGSLYGFTDPKAALGQEFTWAGKQFIFIGLRPRSKKSPVIARSAADGKEYVMGGRALRLLPGYDASIDYYRDND